jgi:predicted kinase
MNVLSENCRKRLEDVIQKINLRFAKIELVHPERVVQDHLAEYQRRKGMVHPHIDQS